MSRKKSKNYPSKTTVNLVWREHGKNYGLKLFLSSVLFLVVLGFCSKFLVTDRMTEAYGYEKAAIEAEAELARLEADNADYEQFLREYQHYYFAADIDSGSHAYDAREVLKLVENKVMAGSAVSAVSLDGNILTVSLDGVNLDRTSAIISKLSVDPMVDSVSLSKANTHDASGSKNTDIVIVLHSEGGESDDET